MPALRRRAGRDGPSPRFSLARHAPRAAEGDADSMSIVAARLLPRLAHLYSAMVTDDTDRADACRAAVDRTLARMTDDPDGSLSIAGPDGWSAASVLGLAMLEIASETGRPFNLSARPRITLGERAVLAAVGIDGLRAREAARLLFTTEDDVHRLLRNGLVQVDQPRYAPSPCPGWSAMLRSLGSSDIGFATTHAQRCDPCNTMWCLHRSRRTGLLALPSIAALAGLGASWVAEPPSRMRAEAASEPRVSLSA